MNSVRSLSWLRLTALILVLALLTACGSQDGTPVSPADSANPAAPAKPDALFALGGGDFTLPDPSAGLGELGGYNAVLTLTFEGQQAGAAQSWTRTYYVAASAGGQPAVQVEVTFQTGAGEVVTRQSAAENSTIQATVDEDGTCQMVTLDEAVPLAQRWEPARLLPAVAGAQIAGEENIQGVDARRYTFDEHALGLAGLVSAEGALWIDPDSGLVLRYTLAQQGGEDFFGDGMNGRLTWEYALDRDGAAPAWPPGCTKQNAAFDLPLPLDAVDVDFSPGMLSFRTDRLPGDVLAFYEPLLAEANWLPGMAQLVDGAGGAPSTPGLEGMLDEETLQALAELQAMHEEDLDWTAEMNEESDTLAVADPSSAVTAVYHRDALELTLTIIPQENFTLILLVLIQS